MKAKDYIFVGAFIEEQRLGGPDEMLVAILNVDVVFDDGKINCKSRIKQTVGSNYKDKIIEVGPIEGLPNGREYDHFKFAEAARKYYTSKIIVVKGT